MEIERSAVGATAVVMKLEVLFVVLGSEELVVTVALLVSFCLLATPEPTCTMIVKLAEAFEARAGMVLVTCVVVFESVKAGPLVWVCETKLVPVGKRSTNETFDAVPGPEFVTVT